MLSTSARRLLPYLLNLAALLLVAGSVVIGAQKPETKGVLRYLPAMVLLPILAVLLVVNVLTGLILLLMRHGSQAAGFAVSAIFIAGLMLLTGLMQVYATLTAGKIGG